MPFVESVTIQLTVINETNANQSFGLSHVDSLDLLFISIIVFIWLMVKEGLWSLCLICVPVVSYMSGADCTTDGGRLSAPGFVLLWTDSVGSAHTFSRNQVCA